MEKRCTCGGVGYGQHIATCPAVRRTIEEDVIASAENICDGGGTVEEHARLLVRDYGVSQGFAERLICQELDLNPCPPEDDGWAIQQQEMRAETFAAEALLGMRPGTTEGWYDEPEPPDPYEDPYYGEEEEE